MLTEAISERQQLTRRDVVSEVQCDARGSAWLPQLASSPQQIFVGSIFVPGTILVTGFLQRPQLQDRLQILV